MEYINKDKLKNIKLDKDNFYVLIDFDRTLTKGKSISCWRVLYYSNLLGDDFKQRYDEIHDKKRFGNEVKIWEQRFSKYMDLLREKNLTEELITEAVKEADLQLRDGAKEFLKTMNNMKVPVIIISCSIGNVIEEFLKFNKCYYDNIYIYSNFYDINENGKNNICNVNPCNKNQVAFANELNNIIKTKEYVLLAGDILEDIKMVKQEKLKNAITVGFLEEKVEQNIEQYIKTFDIVLTDNSSFDKVKEIINIE